MPELQIKLTKQRYLMKLLTHSQYVRWLRSTPCYCIDQLGSVSPTCPTCLGRGRVFSHQLEFDVWDENSVHCGNRVYPAYTPLVKVDSVTRKGCYNLPYTVTGVFGTYAEIAGTPQVPALPNRNEWIGVNYTYSKEKLYIDGPATYIGRWILTLPLPGVKTVESEYVQGDIVRVTTVYNVTKDYYYKVTAFHKNEIYLDSTPVPAPDPEDPPIPVPVPDVSDVWQVTAGYIDPHKLLLNQTSERDRRDGAYIAVEGDANLTVPYEYYVGEGDIIIQLIGEQRGHAVLIMTEDGVQELPAFDVTKVLTIEDGTNAVYTPEVDFTVKRGNQLIWLTEHKPADKFSCIFMYHPAFTIFGVKPTVRTPENLRMPRRVGLKSFDKTNVNYQLHQVQPAEVGG